MSIFSGALQYFDIHPFGKLFEFVRDVSVNHDIMVFDTVADHRIDHFRNLTVKLLFQRIAAQNLIRVQRRSGGDKKTVFSAEIHRSLP